MAPSAPIGQHTTLDYLVPGSIPVPNLAPVGLPHVLQFDVLPGPAANRPPTGADLTLSFDLTSQSMP